MQNPEPNRSQGTSDDVIDVDACSREHQETLPAVSTDSPCLLEIDISGERHTGRFDKKQAAGPEKRKEPRNESFEVVPHGMQQHGMTDGGHTFVQNVPENLDTPDGTEAQLLEYDIVGNGLCSNFPGVFDVPSGGEARFMSVGHAPIVDLSHAVRRDANTGLFHSTPSGRNQFTAEALQVHAPNEVSLPSLETSETGVLHVLPQWTGRMVLSDLCYKYSTWGSWVGSIPFLEEGMKHNNSKRRYKCSGVKMCPLTPPTFRYVSHGTSSEYDALQRRGSELGSVAQSEAVRILQRARSIYFSVCNDSRKYCTFTGRVRDDVNKSRECNGKPVLRVNSMSGEEFLGCSGYRHDFKVPTDGARGARRRHASRSLDDIGSDGRALLFEMLETGIIPITSTEECFFVAQKGARRPNCPAHGTTLVSSSECPAEMLVIEPKWQLKENADFRVADVSNGIRVNMNGVVTYVMCKGKHNHPPPPPPVCTTRKSQLLLQEAENSPDATPAHVKLRSQLRLMRQSGASGTALQIDTNKLYEILATVRKNSTGSEAKESHALFAMVADQGNTYVRDIQTCEDGFITLLGTDEMFNRCIGCGSLAGDATFKIVTENRRAIQSTNWYLYNIVARENSMAIGGKGVVVSRFLMNRLTSMCYRKVWVMFLTAVMQRLSEVLDVPRSLVSLSVPYIPISPTQKAHSLELNSITVDFDAAEIEGISMALQDTRGGTALMHLNGILVGCSVHFQRDARRRAMRRGENSSEALVQAMMSMNRASNKEDAEVMWEVIKSMDPTWARWAKSSTMKPLVIPAYSNMSPQHRALAFSDTNAVESQNRRANYICGIRLSPGIAAEKLRELDVISTSEAPHSAVAPPAKFRKPTRRGGSLLQPCREEDGEKRRRARIAGVQLPPIAKKRSSNGKSPRVRQPNSCTPVEKDLNTSGSIQRSDTGNDNFKGRVSTATLKALSSCTVDNPHITAMLTLTKEIRKADNWEDVKKIVVDLMARVSGHDVTSEILLNLLSDVSSTPA